MKLAYLPAARKALTSSSTDQFDTRPTEAVIDLQQMQLNLAFVRKEVGNRKIMSVVKGNAYGHGLVECARAMDAVGIDSFGVGTVGEGVQLKRLPVRAPVLVLGPVASPEYEVALRNHLELHVSNLRELELIESLSRDRPARVHVRIEDTHLRSESADPELIELFRRVSSSRHVRVVGIAAHFSDFAETARSTAQEKISRFQSLADVLQGHYLNPFSASHVVRHIANSETTISLPESRFDMVRLGDALYGYVAGQRPAIQNRLLSVLSLHSEVTEVQSVKPGEYVTYGKIWKTSESGKIAIVPIGYADGFPRGAAGNGHVLIRGRRWPIVRAVRMDQIYVSIGNEKIEAGEPVVLLGGQGSEQISIYELVQTCGLIEMVDLTCHLTARLRRSYIHGQELEGNVA